MLSVATVHTFLLMAMSSASAAAAFGAYKYGGECSFYSWSGLYKCCFDAFQCWEAGGTGAALPAKERYTSSSMALSACGNQVKDSPAVASGGLHDDARSHHSSSLPSKREDRSSGQLLQASISIQDGDTLPFNEEFSGLGTFVMRF